jgi:hypothetical protein
VTIQRYVSNELTHFAGRGRPEEEQYQTLLAILRSGELRAAGSGTPGTSATAGSSSLSTHPLGKLTDHEMFMADVVCFCDIPVGDLAIHTNKYGPFGLAFLKTFLLAYGATPVFYVAKDAAAPGKYDGAPLGEVFQDEVSEVLDFLQRIREMHSGSGEAGEATPEYRLFIDSFGIHSFLGYHVLSFLKFFDGRSTDVNPENFYMEREWRILGSMEFQVSDVHRVFIPSNYAARFRRDLPEYNGQLTFP